MTLNEAIETYAREDARAKAAAKAAKAAKEFILAMAGDLDQITTDVWTVYIKTTESLRLDQAALLKDFPDIKETYGKTTLSRSLDPHPVAAAAGRTA
jgi:hypothetical protein